jgi:4-hydroxybenzoate polyprenyltransferase
MTSTLTSWHLWARMIKWPHSVFALPFALIGAFMAGRHIEGVGRPYWGQLGLILVCMVSARSVAMTFNRVADAEIDARNPRTAARPLAAGTLGRAFAYGVLVLFAGTFGIACLGFHVLYDNSWPMLLSGPVLVYLCGYSFTKRLTRWSHYYLGSALALSPLAAWLAVHPASVGLPAVLLMVAVTCWVAGFDIIYACQDIEVDRRDGLFSLPSRLGPRGALWIARCSHVISALALVVLGLWTGLGVLYWIGVVAASVLLAVENALVHPGDYSKVNVAFFTVNGVVSVLLAVTTISDLLLTA